MKSTTLIARIRKSDIINRIIKGAFWAFTGTALAKFIVLVAGILCAHILGKEAYGEFGMVRSTINLFVVFGTAGLGMTAAKFISEYRKTQKSRVSKIFLVTNRFALLTGLVVTTLILIFSSTIAEATLNAPHLATPIRVGAILLYLTVLNGAQDGCLSGFEDFKSIAINTFLGSIAESALMLLGGYLYGVTGAIMGYGCGFVVLYLCNNIAIRRNLKKEGICIKKEKITFKDFKVIYQFTLPAALASFMTMPVYWIMRTMLVNKEGFGSVAIFDAADQWRVIIIFIPVAVSKITLPILSSLTSTNKHKFWKVLSMNLFLNTSIATILALGVIAFSSTIMFSYGNDFNDPEPLKILALSTIPYSIANIIGISIASRSKMWAGFVFNTIWAGLMVISCTYFLKCGYGATSLAYAALISYIIHAILQFIYLFITFRNNNK